MPSDDEISADELEALANGETKAGIPAITASSHLPTSSWDQLLLLIKLYFELYPRIMLSGSAFTLGLLLWAWSPWQSWGKAMNRNHMTRDYTALQDNFQFQTAQIDHWCLFGGDDKCYCEDPTESSSRDEIHGWVVAHLRNKKLVQDAMAKERVDVVFLGDQTIQAWDGRWVDRPAPEGIKIARLFNDTFNSDTSELKGVALGIYGDRINNILWRMQHGEMPRDLNPKVIWLAMGTNDLALAMCSEEVVTLGIMRVAEEAHHMFPHAVVVIQGILPRTHHKDGSLEGKEGAHHYDPHKSNKKHFLFHGKHSEDESDGNIAAFEPMVPGGGRKLEESIISNAYGNAVDGSLEQDLDINHRRLEEADDVDDAVDDDGDGDEIEDNSAPAETTSSSTSTAGAVVTTPRSPPTTTATKEAIETPDGATLSQYRFAEKGFAEIERQAPQPLYDFYLWPSIQCINKELEGFCSKHEHFVYFDAANLVLGSIGNDYYRSEHKSIIAPLMPNFVHLSALGHQVVMGAIADELERIIWDGDETNDIEKKGDKQR